MRNFTKHPSQRKQVNSSTDTTRIPVPYNKYFEIDPPTRDADLLPGDRIEDYDCTFLAYLTPRPEYEDTLDMWPVLTDLTDYPVCDLVAGRLYPITPEDIHRHLGDTEYLVESTASTKQFTKHPHKVTAAKQPVDSAKNATYKTDRRLSPTSERYRDYLIVLDRNGYGYNIYDKHRELEDHGYPSMEAAKKAVDDIIREENGGIEAAEEADVSDYEDDIREISQEFTSENTSINSGKLPAIFKMVHLEPGTINIDYGGGKFDNVAEYLAPMDVVNLVYDPYNRTPEHNKEVIRTVRKAGGADTATCSNVLNVIKEPEVRQNILQNIKKLVKPSGTVYITVYEGSGKGNEGPTKSGYQLNRKTADYLEEIKEVFPDAIRKGKLIIAHPNVSAVNGSSGQFVGEPSSYAPNSRRSYYDNPSDWEEKLEAVRNLVASHPSLRIRGSSPWGANVYNPQHKEVFKFDFWEDSSSFDDQLADFENWLAGGSSAQVTSATSVSATFDVTAMSKKIRAKEDVAYGHCSDLFGPDDFDDDMFNKLQDIGFILDVSEDDPLIVVPKGTVLKYVGTDRPYLLYQVDGTDLILYFEQSDFELLFDDDYEVVESATQLNSLRIESSSLPGRYWEPGVEDETNDLSDEMLLDIYSFLSDYDSEDINTMIRDVMQTYDLSRNLAKMAVWNWRMKDEDIPFTYSDSIEATLSRVGSVSRSELHQRLMDEATGILQRPDMHIGAADLSKRLRITEEEIEPDVLRIEVFCPLPQDKLQQLSSELDHIVQEYCPAAYFDYAEPKVAEAYIVDRKINANTRVYAASSVSIKEIHDKLLNVASKRLQEPDMGFPLDELADYLIVEEEETEDGALRIEVRYELSYEGMTKLAEALDPIVAKYDKNAYFDMVAPGIMEAFIFNRKITAAKFPELSLDPPEQRELTEYTNFEYLTLSLDDDVVVSDGAIDFLATPTFVAGVEEWSLNPDVPDVVVYSEDVAENVLQLIEPEIPLSDGIYHVKGDVTLAYDVLYVFQDDIPVYDAIRPRFNYAESELSEVAVESAD